MLVLFKVTIRKLFLFPLMQLIFQHMFSALILPNLCSRASYFLMRAAKTCVPISNIQRNFNFQMVLKNNRFRVYLSGAIEQNYRILWIFF